MRWLPGRPTVNGYYWILAKETSTDDYALYLARTEDGNKYLIMGESEYHDFHDVICYIHLPIDISEPEVIRALIIKTEQGIIIPSIGFFDWEY